MSNVQIEELIVFKRVVTKHIYLICFYLFDYSIVLKRVVIYKAYILICKDAILWNNDKRRFITTRKSMNIKRLDKKGNKLYTLSIPSAVHCHRVIL